LIVVDGAVLFAVISRGTEAAVALLRQRATWFGTSSTAGKAVSHTQTNKGMCTQHE